MKKSIILTFVFFTLFLFSQKKSCYEIKYLDFFGANIEEIKNIKWTGKEFDSLFVNGDFNKAFKSQTNFYIPFLISQIKDFYPKCKLEKDSARFENLVLLYYKMRKIEPPIIKFNKRKKIINFIKKDFYNMVKNDTLLPKMIMTFDDGPFYGIKVQSQNNSKIIQKTEVIFGKILLKKTEGEIVLETYNKNNRLIEAKKINGLNNLNLNDLIIEEKSMIVNSLGITIFGYSQNEKVTLYFSKKGRLKFYFHSW